MEVFRRNAQPHIADMRIRRGLGMRPQQADLCLGPQTHCLHKALHKVLDLVFYP